jgi:nucleotide-binding universal stress UspA family protein
MENKTFPFKRILCAVDFSPASLRALDLAIRLASVNGARIHVLHVIPRIVASLLDVPITTSRWTADQEEKAKRELPKLKQRAIRAGVPASTEIRIGDIDVQILKTVKDVRADVLAIGTHGRRGFERWILGSVAERMLRHSRIPVLLTGSPRKGPSVPSIRRILVAVDFSKETVDAVEYGAGIAAKTRASIVMLHVIEDRSAVVDWSAFPDQKGAIRKRLEELVPSRVKRLCKVDPRVESGEPYQVILKAIKDSRPSLVVLNTHGRGFMSRVLIGSTADRVVRGGAGMSPMLLIPPRE